ncbi:MAG: 2-C-methyl-D-erythritol 4-phosphate cytidylyltransferase [Acidimicrobiia bacterium]
MDTLIIVAGGRGARLGTVENKVYAQLEGRPLLWYPLSAAAHFEKAVRVVIVTRPEDEEVAAAVAAEFPDLETHLAFGGATRHHSERAGLERTAAMVDGDDLIGVQDGARPFLSVDLWRSCAAAALATGGAIPVLEAPGLYRLNGDVLSPVPSGGVRAQTPQVFRAAGLLAAFANSTGPAADTAETIMRHGALQIAAVPGDRRNIKVTFPPDLERATELAKVWRAGRWLTPA